MNGKVNKKIFNKPRFTEKTDHSYYRLFVTVPLCVIEPNEIRILFRFNLYNSQVIPLVARIFIVLLGTNGRVNFSPTFFMLLRTKMPCITFNNTVSASLIPTNYLRLLFITQYTTPWGTDCCNSDGLPFHFFPNVTLLKSPEHIIVTKDHLSMI